MLCPFGLMFDEHRLICMSASQVNCGRRLPPRPVPPTITPSDGGVCPPTGVQMMPHPTNCQQYIICVSGTQVVHTCGNFTHFNPVHLVCDLPELANCEVGSIRPVPPIAQEPPVPRCRGDFQFFRSLTDCSRYWMCIGMVPVKMQCPTGFLWNDRINQCDLPSRVTCSVLR